MIHTFCIAHLPVKFDLPDSAHLVWLGSTPVPPGIACKVIRAAEFAPELNELHPYLAGSTGSYVVRKYLDENRGLWKPRERVSIIQYRKLISNLAMGLPATNYFGCQLLYPDEASVLDIERVNSLVEGAYLLPQIVGIDGILHQYAYRHRVEDFLRYCAIAIEAGFLEPSEIADFFAQRILVPGGVEFGVLPIDIFMELTSKLERVCVAFLGLHKPASEGAYQSRALSFCNERLGSYLLLKRLTADLGCEIHELPSHFFGYMHTVVEPGATSV